MFETRSRLSGKIRVIDHGTQRRLMISGDTLSVYPLDGDWRYLEREYWWRALTAIELPPHPTALLVGLGGGTQIHLLRRLAAPRRITVIEHDPIIVRVANNWFGLDTVEKLEIVCTEADVAVDALTRAGRRFDFIMEDAAYAEAPEAALPHLLALAPLVTPRGSLVVNRHRRGDPRVLARALRRRFHEVRLRRVRRTGENALICCSGPRLSRS